MDGPRFVAFLRERPTPKHRPSKPVTVRDHVDAGMIALAEAFSTITSTDEKEQGYAGIAYLIADISVKGKFKGGEFTVKSPVPEGTLQYLLEEREV
jgi:hypothetical protein